LPADAPLDQIVALKAGIGLDYHENYRSRPNRDRLGLPAELTLVLDGARTVSIAATDSAGHPVAGVPFLAWTIKKTGKRAEVNLSGSWAVPAVMPRTDTKGIATFDWLPSDLRGAITFLTFSEEYHQPEAAELDVAQTTSRVTSVLHRMVRVTGKVTSAEGRPVGGILLQAEGRGKGMYYRDYARTAADGSYQFQLYSEQTYVLAVIDPEWAPPSRAGVPAREGEPLTGLDFRLSRGTLLEGRATVGPDHKPMAQQMISIREEAPGTRAVLERGARTDAEGRYRTHLGRGTYRVTGPDLEEQELLVQDEPRIERNFHLPRPLTGPLRGRVVARTDGRPVAGATVKFEPAGSSRRGQFELVADEQGRFARERWRAPAWVYARSPDGQLAGLAALTSDEEEVEVSLRPAATLVGRFVGKDGKPLPSVRIICRMEIGPKDALAGRVELWAQADRDGRFVLGGVVPGSRCQLSGYTSNTGSNDIQEVTVKGARRTDLGDLVFGLRA
jgi:hypothetical protein